MNHFLLNGVEEIVLSPDKRIYFGRAKGNHIVLNDMLASRRHAEIFWDGDHFVLTDLNSGNGTTVNGTRITACKLSDKDKIQIGSQAYVYRAVRDRSGLKDTAVELMKESSSAQTVAGAMMQPELPDDDFSGVIGAVRVLDLCQMLHMSQRTGLLSIQTPEHDKGLIYWREGEISGGEFQNHEGNDAIIPLLQIDRGHFTFRNGEFFPKTKTTKKTPYLLLEAMRQTDEEA